jgi:hypothetical protein
LATVAIIGIGVFLLRDPVSQHNLERIKLGMTLAEVEAIFGRQADREDWVTSSQDDPLGTIHRFKEWSGNGLTVFISFSADGKVARISSQPNEKSWGAWWDRTFRIPNFNVH